jgi:chaperonin GroES
MTIRPLHDRILVRRDEAETISAGGILLPETAKTDRPQKGTVLDVGPGKRHVTVAGPYTEPCCCKPGDEVLFTKYAGEGIRLGGEDYFLVKDEDIIAVVTPDPDPDPDPEPS